MAVLINMYVWGKGEGLGGKGRGGVMGKGVGEGVRVRKGVDNSR